MTTDDVSPEELARRQAYFDMPAILYKYLSPTLLSVLETRSLRCTPHREFDDLLESFHITEKTNPDELNVIGSPYYVIEIAGYPNWSRATETEARRKMLEWVKLSAATYPGYSVDGIIPMDEFPNAEARRAYAEGFRSHGDRYPKLLILCLSEDPCNRIMWERYAGAGRGICVGFGTTAKFLKEPRLPRRVIYSAEPSRGPAEVAWWRSWVIKHPDYAYEKEWRLRRDQEALKPVLLPDGRTIHTIEFLKSDVRQIMLGPRISEEFKDKVMQLAPGGAEIFQIEAHFESFKPVRIR